MIYLLQDEDCVTHCFLGPEANVRREAEADRINAVAKYERDHPRPKWPGGQHGDWSKWIDEVWNEWQKGHPDNVPTNERIAQWLVDHGYEEVEFDVL